MIANDLPGWLPTFNLVISLAALALVPGLRSGYSGAYRAALGLSIIVLVAGAAFQSNILPLWAWVILGSGGRLAVLGLVVIGTAARLGLHLRPQARHATTLDDLAIQLAELRRITEYAGASAERAQTSASAADDRVLGQAERAVDEQARGVRIEAAIAANTELTQLAADHADHAYKEANSVNEKIASQGAVLVAQGEAAEDDRARVVRIEDVSTDTNERAIDIQGRIK